MKVGSLFDGIGGFPLAASRYNITPAWASEIEKVPIEITKKHFQSMKHLGDITKINGTEIDPVDIITFGSPCQDLSVAGKRAGLVGKRSGLFMEAVRIIKEMRGVTNENYPRIAIWENVPGAFSSNSGEDFRAVLEEMCRIADESCEVPPPPKGKWQPAGLVTGNGWSVAWRVLDAQYWGVPQRRKRIFLVTDFAGQRAGEILFEQEGLRGDTAESEGEREGAAAGAEGSAGECIAPEVLCFEPRSQDGVARAHGEGPTPTLNTAQGGQRQPCVVCAVRMREGCDGGGKGPLIQTDKSGTIATGNDQTIFAPKINCTPEGISGTMSSKWAKGTGGPAGDEHYNLVCYDPKDLGRRPAEFTDQSPTLKQRAGTGGNNVPVTMQQYRVRRLTPLECERLQGFPDGWTEGFADTARYKALGNSVAVPCVEFIMGRITECGRK